jgi:hypothetical protein
MVQPDKSGLLSDLSNTTHIVLQRGDLLKEPTKLRQMRVHSWEHVVQHYSLELQATRYLAFYKHLLANSNRPSAQTNRA